jgi:hypothetical protein
MSKRDKLDKLLYLSELHQAISRRVDWIAIGGFTLLLVALFVYPYGFNNHTATPMQWLRLIECMSVGMSGQLLLFLWLGRPEKRTD